MFQRNVHKVTNLLQICKQKNDKVIEPNLTDQEIEEMFCGIEESCDSIINEKFPYVEPDNVRLHFDSIYNNNLEQQFIPIDYEEQIIQEQIQHEAKEEYPKYQEDFEEKSEEEIEEKSEEENIEELKTEEIKVQQSKPAKKKRNYNKKKK